MHKLRKFVFIIEDLIIEFKHFLFIRSFDLSEVFKLWFFLSILAS